MVWHGVVGGRDPVPSSYNISVSKTPLRGGEVVCSATSCEGGVVFNTPFSGGGAVCPEPSSGGEEVCLAPTIRGKDQRCCGPDRNSNEGRQSANLGRGRSQRTTPKKAGKCDSLKTSYNTQGVAGVQPGPGFTASSPYSCAVLPQAQNVLT